VVIKISKICERIYLLLKKGVVMERILKSFKNLYTGEGVAKQHLLLALLFILPSMMGAALHMIDEKTKSTIVPLLIVGAILGILSIIPLCMLTGTFINFINRRFKDLPGIPAVNLDSLVQGIKVIPLYFVWGLYICVPCFLYTTLVIVGFVGSGLFSPGNHLAVFLAIFGIMFFILLLIIPLFLISPFISMVYMKYCETLEYSAELFNPLLLVRYIRESFKEGILVALKFFVVSIIISFATQIVMIFFIILIFIVSMIFAIALPENAALETNWGFLTSVIIIGGFAGCITGYVQFITNFAYVDNLQDVYKEKFMLKPEEQPEVLEDQKEE